MRLSSGWYVALLAAVAVQRLRELAISRSNEAELGGVRSAPRTYPLMVAAHVGLLTVPLLEVAGRPAARPRWGWAAVLAGGIVLRI